MSYADYCSRALNNGFSKLVFSGVAEGEVRTNVPIGNNSINAYLTGSEKEYASFFVFRIMPVYGQTGGVAL